MSTICPYPGLRPFNENESIFFKGREEHIDAIIQKLQEKKFLMITGASGDGKSSLIYAGLIPRARAGFFKAKFNNWLIADFRPERNPLSNLAAVLNTNLEIRNLKQTEEELGYGFSSLAKLYKESDFYLDYESDRYKKASAEEQNTLKNKSANLLILVDQFEELFTNSENFNAGRPSVQAYTLINLIIETTRIAARENLPLYIVCTMRSDYVGDCATFRGLPEHLVYSQFFVPRLKRQEIHRAILEPAKLAGSKISNSLIERLINDSSDGQDQLPILQHALRQIWKLYNEEGAREMDLLHYAKVGGIGGDSLPENQNRDFQSWLVQQGAGKKAILKNPSLSNVLNAHARGLYQAVSADKSNKTLTESPEEQLKHIFTALTKVNDNRAVRNRASVKELKQALAIDYGQKHSLENLVNTFRLPDNTLLKPFIEENAETVLNDNDILDLTHESLIRNWTELSEWTKTEHENLQVFHDFKKQLDRWNANKQSDGFLLTSGSLNYFQNWKDQSAINCYTLVKYNERNLPFEEMLAEAKLFFEETDTFLLRSALFLKKKRRRVLVTGALIAMALLGFSAWAFTERNKAIEQQGIAVESMKNADSSRKEAVAAKDQSELSKSDAIKNEKAALIAKKQAEQMGLKAVHASADAKKNFLIAEENARTAQVETQRARQALEESENSKNEALSQKNIAVKAEEKSKQLSYISLAQNLAIKSELRADDPEIQALLALQSYNFIQENGGETQDPIIYSALRNAQKSYLKKNQVPKISADWEQREARFSSDGHSMITADKAGNVYNWDIENQKLIKKSVLIAESPIEKIFLPNLPASKLFAALQNKSIGVWSLADGNIPKTETTLKGHTGAIRKFVYNEVSDLLATAGKDSLLILWDLSGHNQNPEPKKIKLDFLVKDMTWDLQSNQIILLAETGKLYHYSHTAGPGVCSEIMHIQADAMLPTSLCYNRKNDWLAIGYNNGQIRLYAASALALNKIQLVFSYAEFEAPIEKIVFNDAGSFMAGSSADREMNIFDLNKKGLRPLEIKDLKGKPRCFAFDKDNKLVVALSNHDIQIIETSAENLARSFCPELKRNFTKEEWSQNIGMKIPYERTCSNIK